MVSRPLRVLTLALGLTALGQLPACSGGFGEPDLKVIVISLDTTRPDHLSAYGYDRDTTPTLARLASEGALFTNARSTTSWTRRGGCASGRWRTSSASTASGTAWTGC